MRSFTQFFAISVGLLLGSTGGWAADQNYCAPVLAQVERKFQDIYGQLSADQASQLELMRGCVRRERICVVAEEHQGQGYRLIAGKSLSEKSFVDSERLVSVSAIGYLQNTKNQNLCVLARYSGGSATSWVVDAWSINRGTPLELDTTKATIRGEGISPAELLRAMSNSIPAFR